MHLSRFARRRYTVGATPIEKLERFSAELGGIVCHIINHLKEVKMQEKLARTNVKFNYLSILLFLSAFFILLSGGFALSAEETADGGINDFILEDTVITATKRPESLQDVPQSITAFSADEIKFMGAQNFGDMIESVPGVELRRMQSGIGSVSIRGIAAMSSVTGGAGASVGYYLDELPLTMAAMFPDIANFDTARVEVLRGPQGTLFGEGSMAGTIRLIANKPDATEFDAYIDMTYSNTEGGEDSYSANGMLNLPLIKDKMAVRLVTLYGDDGGYIDRTDPATGAVIEKNVNDSQTIGGRMALRLVPSDNLTLDANLLYSKSDRGRRNIATEEMDRASLTPESSEDELFGLNMTIQYDLSFADLISSTSSFDREAPGPADNSGLNGGVEQFMGIMSFVTGLYGLPGPNWTTPDGVYIDLIIESEAIAQELRLVSKGDGVVTIIQTGPTAPILLDAYQTINLRAGVMGDSWNFHIFANNVMDKRVNEGCSPRQE